MTLKKNKLKPLHFHSSHEEMRQFSQEYVLNLDGSARLAEMQKLNRKAFGENYGSKVSKTVEIFVGLPGEDVQQFYKRINQNG